MCTLSNQVVVVLLPGVQPVVDQDSDHLPLIVVVEELLLRNLVTIQTPPTTPSHTKYEYEYHDITCHHISLSPHISVI